jgi:hypothetical protein
MFAGPNGVIGVTRQAEGYAVFGYDLSSSGGHAGNFNSVNGVGLYASSGSPTSYAGLFVSPTGNGVSIIAGAGKTGLVVSGGTKNALVPTSQGDRLLYTEESSEVWFTDYGFRQLENGSVTIAIDPLFAETVDLSAPYHVFVQSYGDAELYVTNRTANSFEVRLRSGGGDPNVEFSYRLVASRLGYAGDRLEAAGDIAGPQLSGQLQPRPQGEETLPGMDTR